MTKLTARSWSFCLPFLISQVQARIWTSPFAWAQSWKLCSSWAAAGVAIRRRKAAAARRRFMVFSSEAESIRQLRVPERPEPFLRYTTALAGVDQSHVIVLVCDDATVLRRSRADDAEQRDVADGERARVDFGEVAGERLI